MNVDKIGTIGLLLWASIAVGCSDEFVHSEPAPPPECATDADCEGVDQCSNVACSAGACVRTGVSGRSCSVDGGAGECEHGICRAVVSCAQPSDCPGRECADRYCVDAVCRWSRRNDGWTCHTDAGAEGVCDAGVCAVK